MSGLMHSRVLSQRKSARADHGSGELPLLRSAQPIRDSRLAQVVRRHFHPHAIANRQPNKMFPHLAGNVSEHFMFVVEDRAKHRAREHGGNRPFHFDRLFDAHSLKMKGGGTVRSASGKGFID